MQRSVLPIAILAVLIIIGGLIALDLVFLFPNIEGPESGDQVSPTLEAAENPEIAPPSVKETATVNESPSTSALENMTLDEKVGQLFMVHFDSPVVDPTLRALISECQVGGIILFGPNIRDGQQIETLIRDAQQLASETGAAIPLFVAVDQEGWPVARLQQTVTTFPSNMAVAASGDLENARQIGLATGQELRALGINMNLAPVLDVNTNPANPVIGLRSFGSDPQKVADFGTAMIAGLQGAGVVPVAKHFPGHGDTAEDSHLTLPRVDKSLDELYAVELVPFQAAINAGVPAIMSAHIVVPALGNGAPSTLSAQALTTLLRQDLGFEGVIATDSMGMNAITGSFGSADAALRALMAGADLLMYGNDPGQDPQLQLEICRQLKQQAQIDRQVAERVEASAQRIIDLKRQIGLLDGAATAAASEQRQNHSELSLEVARESITLIAADETLLPILPDDNVIFIYPDVIDGLPQIAAALGNNVQFVPVSLDPAPNQISAVANQALGADKIVIIAVDAFTHPQQAALYQALQGFKPIVVVMGLPYDINALPGAAAYLASFGYAPTSQQAVVEVLFGQRQATGVLPVALE